MVVAKSFTNFTIYHKKNRLTKKPSQKELSSLSIVFLLASKNLVHCELIKAMKIL